MPKIKKNPSLLFCYTETVYADIRATFIHANVIMLLLKSQSYIMKRFIIIVPAKPKLSFIKGSFFEHFPIFKNYWNLLKLFIVKIAIFQDLHLNSTTFLIIPLLPLSLLIPLTNH